MKDYDKNKLTIQRSFSNNKKTLYLVVTPIGNMKEFPLRSQEILQQVAIIFCEDTRVTKKILSHFCIKKSMLSLHKHNEKERIKLVLKYLENDQDVALLSDAGYPLISDPGEYLTHAVINAGYNVVAVGGSSALLSALLVADIKPYPFTFFGFLDQKIKKIEQQVNDMKYRSETLVFYIGINHLEKTLKIMNNIFGNRKICLARELTKIHETLYRMTLTEILLIDLAILKGECVLIVEGYQEVKENYDNLTIQEHVKLVSEQQNITIKEAIKEVANIRNVSKSKIYKEFHINKN